MQRQKHTFFPTWPMRWAITLNIVAIDEPGGNRNRSINIKAQHKTRRAAITQIYFKQHLLQKS